MGLSNAIAGGIMLFTIVVVMLNFPTLLDSITDVSDSTSKMSDKENAILKTKIQIDSISATGNSDSVDFDITNTGTTKIWNYEKLDVLITYDTLTSTETDILAYSSTCEPSAGQWCLSSFTGDNLDPTLLNPDESVEIHTTLLNTIKNNGNVIVLIATDNGVSTTKSIIVS